MMMGLFLGFVVGALFVWYLERVREYNEVMADWNGAMTDMFNMVPQSQRFGYTEDFPADQKWHL